MTNNKVKDLIIEDAVLWYRNFEGREERNKEGRIMNQAGARNFHVEVPAEMVDQLVEDGWNVKIKAPVEEGDPARHLLKVNVSYKFRDPDIRMYVGNRETFLNQDSIANLDYAEIVGADVIIHPSPYTKDDGSTGLSGYCQELRVVIRESPFADKYAGYCGPEE